MMSQRNESKILSKIETVPTPSRPPNFLGLVLWSCFVAILRSRPNPGPTPHLDFLGDEGVDPFPTLSPKITKTSICVSSATVAAQVQPGHTP